MNRKKMPYGTKIPAHFSLQERDLVREHTFYPGRVLDLAVVAGDGIRVELSLDDIEDIQGYVAAEANHAEDPKLERQLDALSDRLQSFLDSCDEQQD